MTTANNLPGLCQPGCPFCGGCGYVRRAPQAQVWEADFGKIDPCPGIKPEGILERIARGRLDLRIGLTADEIRELHWGLIKDGLSDGYKAREAGREACQAGHGMLLLIGRSGQAKTPALKIAVATAIREGRRAAYANLLAILDDIRLAFDEREGKQTELVRRMAWWLDQQVLAIDELDKVNSTDWAMERMFQLIDARHQRAVRGEALTLFAANYSSADELSEYIRSRIEDTRFGGKVIYLNGPDGRRAVPKGWRY